MPHIPGSPFCPCTAVLLVYKLVTAFSDEAPLLCYPSPSGPRPLSYELFISRLKAILTGLGVDHTKYAGHSFCRGGASLALACNLPTELIKLQGDWRSDCYQRYLDPDLDTKFTATIINKVWVFGEITTRCRRTFVFITIFFWITF